MDDVLTSRNEIMGDKKKRRVRTRLGIGRKAVFFYKNSVVCDNFYSLIKVTPNMERIISAAPNH